eukprot:TRINITY_DN5940_c0_g1_i2.p1 TRINITY_DN5940_c0_g1~~TRINITY_DN5940_c0_g1_i2.p1  ORF type:complete len:145 (-),score=29.80 TRINITY_DN5940_c0_g1_i2:231-665(-)
MQEKIICPIDRRPVSMLIPSYTIRSEIPPIDENLATQVDLQVEEYNIKFSLSHRNISDLLNEDILLMKRMYRNSLFYKALMLITLSLVLLYIILPMDLLPDTSLVGYLGDLVIVFLGFWFIYYAVEWYREKLLLQIIHQRRNNS